MKKENIALVSVFLNLLFGGVKVFLGFSIKSTALLADGLHSALDVISSFFSYLGIKLAEKPPSKEYPYGYENVEAIASLFIIFLLLLSVVWIIYEGVLKILKGEKIEFSVVGIIVVILTIFLNLFLAKLKITYGRKEKSISLIADAEHSKADAFSSCGVLLGLFLAPYFKAVDGIVAIFIGLYLLKEGFEITKEIQDTLLGKRDAETEEKIKKICEKMRIELSEIKTKKIGLFSFAELKVKFSPFLKVKEVELIVENLKKELFEKIENLKYVVIQIASHPLEEKVFQRRPQRESVKKFFEGRLLSEIESGKKVKVIAIKAGREAKRKLKNLGIFENVEIEVIKNDFWGPLKIRIYQKEVLIGRGLASKVIVKE